MAKLLKLAAGVVSLTAAMAASASPTTDHALALSRDLVESCESPSTALRTMCLGYLAAISDDIERDQLVPGNKLICRPRRVELEIYRQAYVAFAKENPQYRERSSFEAVKAAFAQKWPCPKERK